jgi:hypothetical protein
LIVFGDQDSHACSPTTTVATTLASTLARSIAINERFGF